MTESLAQVIDHCLAGAVDLHVIIGPATWQPADTTEGRRWYFTVATCGPDGFRCDQVVCGSRPDTERGRSAFMVAMMARLPRVIHDTDDELYMARLCESLWPGERISRLRRGVERERGQV
ncbi:MAG: hypothetical protein AB7O63_13145 [Reyranellaceae bacterium]